MASPVLLDDEEYIDDRFPDMQDLFDTRARTSSSATSSDYPINTPSDTTKETSTEAPDSILGMQCSSDSSRSAYHLSPLDLASQLQRLQTELHALDMRQNVSAQYNQAQEVAVARTLRRTNQQLSTLERQISNLNLHVHFDDMRQRIEAQEQHKSLTLDGLQRQINTLQRDEMNTSTIASSLHRQLADLKIELERRECAAIEAQHKQRKLADLGAQQKQCTGSQLSKNNDLEFVRTCLLSDNLSHADRYAALRIVARMQRGVEDVVSSPACAATNTQHAPRWNV